MKRARSSEFELGGVWVSVEVQTLAHPMTGLHNEVMCRTPFWPNNTRPMSMSPSGMPETVYAALKELGLHPVMTSIRSIWLPTDEGEGLWDAAKAAQTLRGYAREGTVTGRMSFSEPNIQQLPRSR